MRELIASLPVVELEKLEREAARRGITAEALASELFKTELRARTKPKTKPAKVVPIRGAF